MPASIARLDGRPLACTAGLFALDPCLKLIDGQLDLDAASMVSVDGPRHCVDCVWMYAEGGRDHVGIVGFHFLIFCCTLNARDQGVVVSICRRL